MSAGPRISASSSGRGLGDLVHVAQPARRLDQRLEPDRPLPPGRRASASSAAARCDVGGALGLGHDHRVEPLAGAGDRPEVVGEPGRRGPVDADAHRRRGPVAASRAPRRPPPAPPPSAPAAPSPQGRRRPRRPPAPAPSRASGPGERARKGRNAGPSSAHEHTSSASLDSPQTREERRWWKRAARATVGGPYFEDLERGQVFDAPGADADLGPCRDPPGDRRRPDAAGARRAAEPRGDRLRRSAGPSEPRLRRGDRAVHRADPAGARQPLLPRPGARCARSFAATPCGRGPRSSP